MVLWSAMVLWFKNKEEKINGSMVNYGSMV